MSCILASEEAYMNVVVSLLKQTHLYLQKIRPGFSLAFPWKNIHICTKNIEWINKSNKCAVYAVKYAHGYILLCFIKVYHQSRCFHLKFSDLFNSYSSGLLNWHWGNRMLTLVPVCCDHLEQYGQNLTQLKKHDHFMFSPTDQRKHQSSVSLALCGEFIGDRWIPCTNGQ